MGERTGRGQIVKQPTPEFITRLELGGQYLGMGSGSTIEMAELDARTNYLTRTGSPLPPGTKLLTLNLDQLR